MKALETPNYKAYKAAGESLRREEKQWFIN